MKHKRYSILTVAREQTIASVVDVLTRNKIGAALAVDESGRLIGIISERDIIRGLAEHGYELLELPVDSLMTCEVVTCSLEDSVVGLMEVMTNRLIRHLPVVQKGRLRGIVSIVDVVKQRLAEAQFEVDELRRYISSS